MRGQDTASAEVQPDLLENWNIVFSIPDGATTVRTVAVSLSGLCCFLCDCSALYHRLSWVWQCRKPADVRG